MSKVCTTVMLLSSFSQQYLYCASVTPDLMREYMAEACMIMPIVHYRVVLDEAQTIKNANTRCSHAVWKLKAEKRWCLSGTPIQNSIKDLFSFFRFLRYEPYCNVNEFNIFVKDKIARDPVNGFECLRAILKVVQIYHSLI